VTRDASYVELKTFVRTIIDKWIHVTHHASRVTLWR
jgi:hypothetical protein